jgi:putative transcriptional regulator
MNESSGKADKIRLMAKQGKQRSPSFSVATADVSDFSSSNIDTASEKQAEIQSLQLADHFLIAMPSMLDPVFGGTVVYICEHNANGALGMIINRPTDLAMDVLFERLDLSLEITPHDQVMPPVPVLFGGPVQVERGFVLHAPLADYNSSLTVSDDVSLTTSRDVLEAAAQGHGPRRLVVTLGCAGWGAGQLEEEILRNGWLTVRADPAILFDMPSAERFAAAMNLLGIDPTLLTGEAGHA